MTLTANKGEWSELYVLYRLFADHKIAAANNRLEPTGHFYNFLKIFRNDKPGEHIVYDLEYQNEVIVISNRAPIKRVSTLGLLEKTRKIFDKIKRAQDRTFEIIEAENLMPIFSLTKIKANSTQKSDLVATIKNDIISETEPYGFSIKSRVGGASTLLNASSGTNFIYKITGLNVRPEIINAISTKSKVRDRLNAVLNYGGKIVPAGMASRTFADNLKTIDTKMPQIISEMLLEYYLGHCNTMGELCSVLYSKQLFDLTESQIVSKIRNFLKIVALGMVPQSEWNDRLSSYGGYIVVREDGTLVCYHLYNEDAFKDYLFDNTKLDTPSTLRHNFGSVYENKGELFINLNLQIRFIR